MSAKNSEVSRELENQLSRLRSHYDYFEGAQSQEVLEWARFFQGWAKLAVNQGHAWAKTHLQQANLMVSEFSARRPAPRAYETLKRVMQEAADDMRSETQRLSEKAL